MSRSLPQNAPSTHEQIAALAHKLWEQSGRPAERDLEFWLRAEEQIAATPRGSKAPAALAGASGGNPQASKASATTSRRNERRL